MNSFAARLRGLSDPLVRDLAGVMAAPSLLSDLAFARYPQLAGAVLSDEDCGRELELRWADLLALDRDPRPLLEWTERAVQAGSGPLLGRYFETLVEFWLWELRGVARLKSGIQVRRERTTVGELDFVFEEAGEREPQHWEVAVKFYLCTAIDAEGASSASAFYGTMTRDRMDLKVGKLALQLGRAHEVEGAAALREADFLPPVRSRALVKGALFYPWKAQGASLTADWGPKEASPAHLRGWWASALPVWGDPAASRWVELDRRRWLSPFLERASRAKVATLSGVVLTREEMVARADAHFGEFRTALMVARLERRPDDGLWEERDRGLLVHEGWPWPVRE
jgi:hypothetical protein